MTSRPANWYSDTAISAPERPPLAGEARADVCVVGAGMTGSAAALFLAERGLSVRVIEAESVGFGASGRSGGQLIAGYAAEMATVERLLPEARSRLYWDLGVEAVDLTRALVARHAIACDFTDGHIHAGFKPRHIGALEEMIRGWEGYGYPGLEWLDGAAIGRAVAAPGYLAGVRDRRGGHLHPLNYTLGLAKAAEAAGAVFHESSPYLGHEETAQGVVVRTPAGLVRARWLILAGNAYFKDRPRGLAATVMPVGTYIIATEPLGEARARALIPGGEAVADIAFVLNYYRLTRDHRLLFGGGVSYSRIDPLSIRRTLGATMVRTFPQLAGVGLSHAWGGHVAITVNRLPHFGRIGKRCLFAHGFSGHGVGLTGLAGKLMAEVVAGSEERFDLMARIPHLSFPGGRSLRLPLLVLGSTWLRLRDLL
ncbi:NAD(P)/FAD-dependent oxidoreductase [Rhodospirillum rubrum]|uniref:FAD dependent oxidoreductase n=1 Tax=Rhodospirillum rubrum (strain ATCC 11170 / ATH 1.1.1 / DSM 467 / LMG 4362 / NCIMB 8255 / S1) TaxID=269796 RepID=Q2RVM5_RHORT|nr:FAD-binding oxidoreductase [Rhodospirillum rubrum]ABC21820.1 FAD dependent oxidoreductase [Rhodospirillum rubrum ATCC 11170]MBK5953377.1 FAD-binding oxidoreductase [Rhodospirillum rubrum]QXG81482.1 FAD-binding oxidoreductase [Rhodospirillum rubrum]HAQ01329.1 FAD-binding oxidoreductase [Rhodospirillum rubrum]HCF19478.1 FAD-binding oxidoreductase [Rhodospirillum rubrum]